MSRRTNLTKALASGYGAMAVNVAFTLASVPLALSYLSKAEFGLWALVSQLATYLALLDLGMSGSISRILVDHKDDKGGGAYGTVVKTGTVVTLVQGVLIGCLGAGVAPLLLGLLDVPLELGGAFVQLLVWQCVITGFSLMGRIFTHLLFAHQRYDATNYAQAASLSVSFAVLWWGFESGLGVFSLIWSSAAGTVAGIVVSFLGCVHGAVWPHGGAWGKVSLPVFRQLLAFGVELFAQVLGWQLLNASQVILISKFFGLETAAIYSICTKTFTLAQQAVWRVHDYSIAAFSEMSVRGEGARLRDRFRDVWVLSSSLGVAAGIIVAVCNQSFVSLWTGGAIAWHPANDWLLGLLMVAYTVNRVHGGLAWAVKDVRRMRYVYLAEGAAFVIIASLVARPFGLPGVFAASILCDFAISGIYGWGLSARHLAVARTTALEWLRPPLTLAVVTTPIALALWASSRALAPAAQLAFNGLLVGAVVLTFFWKIGLRPGMRLELAGMFSRGRVPAIS